MKAKWMKMKSEKSDLVSLKFMGKLSRFLTSFAKLALHNLHGMDKAITWLSNSFGRTLSALSTNLILNVPNLPGEFKDFIDDTIVGAITLLILEERATVRDNGLNGRSYCESHIRKIFCNETFVNPIINEACLLNLRRISERGLLKVLLTVYVKLLPKFVDEGFESQAKKESIRIFNFVASLSTKDKWKPHELQFEGKLINFVIVPVAAKYRNATQFYMERIEKYSQISKVAAIFVLAIGYNNSLVAKRAAYTFSAKYSKEFRISIKTGYQVRTKTGSSSSAISILLQRTSFNHHPLLEK